jgi:hypothetical protein
MDASRDFRGLLRSLSDAGVRYVIVGAYADIYHTEPRYTKDLDVWAEPGGPPSVKVGSRFRFADARE